MEVDAEPAAQSSAGESAPTKSLSERRSLLKIRSRSSGDQAFDEKNLPTAALTGEPGSTGWRKTPSAAEKKTATPPLSSLDVMLGSWEETGEAGRNDDTELHHRAPSPTGSASGDGFDDTSGSSSPVSPLLEATWNPLRVLALPPLPGASDGVTAASLFSACGGCGRVAGVTAVPPLDPAPRLVWGAICGSAEPPLPHLTEAMSGSSPALGHYPDSPFAATPAHARALAAAKAAAAAAAATTDEGAETAGAADGAGPWSLSSLSLTGSASLHDTAGAEAAAEAHREPAAPALLKTSKPWGDDDTATLLSLQALPPPLPADVPQLVLDRTGCFAGALSWDNLIAPEPPPPPPLSARYEPAPWAEEDDDASEAEGDAFAEGAAAQEEGRHGNSARKSRQTSKKGPSIDLAASMNSGADADTEEGSSKVSWGDIVALTPPALAQATSLGPWEEEKPAAAALPTGSTPTAAENAAETGAKWRHSGANAVLANEPEQERAEEDEGLQKLRARLEPYLRARALMAVWGQMMRPLPLVLPRHAGHRLAVCVDLEGTLLHSQPEPLARPDFEVEFSLGAFPLPSPQQPNSPHTAAAAAGAALSSAGSANTTIKAWGRWRPHLHDFLRAVAAEHELFVYTSAVRPFAEAIAQQMDPAGELISGVLCREQCVASEDGSRIKDLEVLGRGLSDVVMIDTAFGFHLDNVVPVTRWAGAEATEASSKDSELPRALAVLQTLRDAEDVRTPLREAFQVRRLVETSTEILAARMRGEFEVD